MGFNERVFGRRDQVQGNLSAQTPKKSTLDKTDGIFDVRSTLANTRLDSFDLNQLSATRHPRASVYDRYVAFLSMTLGCHVLLLSNSIDFKSVVKYDN